MYSLGESVVNRNNQKMATVVCTDPETSPCDDDGREFIKIRYEESGTEEWISTTQVANFLLEIEPHNDGEQLL